MKNIIRSIWVEKWNWKPLKFLQEGQEKKIEIQRKRTALKNVISGKVGLNDEPENK